MFTIGSQGFKSAFSVISLVKQFLNMFNMSFGMITASPDDY